MSSVPGLVLGFFEAVMLAAVDILDPPPLLANLIV